MKALKNTLLAVSVIALAFLLSGSVPRDEQKALLQQELAKLTQQGLTYTIDAEGMVTIVEPHSGRNWRKSSVPLLNPKQPTYTNLPTLNINLSSLDTNLYNWKYHYLTTAPVDGESGFPLVGTDMNHNGRIEVYGNYQEPQMLPTTRIYEWTGTYWSLAFQFPLPNGGALTEYTDDIDRNGLSEVYMVRGDSVFAFEQQSVNSLPTIRKLAFRQWMFDATGIPSELSDMDGDERKDLVYRGSEGSAPPRTNKTYVARYDSVLNNFAKIWSAQLPANCNGSDECAGQLATGDFDSDGRREIITSRFAGNVYVLEYVKQDSFALVWSDSLSTAGRVTAGDVDGDGVEEFFAGGTQAESDAVHFRIFVYNASGNNNYVPVFAFNIYPVGFFFVDHMRTIDLDGDGAKELLIGCANGVVVIKGNGIHNYQLFYFSRPRYFETVSAFDVNGDGVSDLAVSLYNANQSPITTTQMFTLDTMLVSVREVQKSEYQGVDLHCYPNPTNGNIQLRYRLDKESPVRLEVYDITGRLVAQLVNESLQQGDHTVHWSNDHVSSGIYFVKLSTNSHTLVRKAVIIR